ncbi:hypothetical protein BKA82DRAFT_4359477 [Pisolithus tinctorius]|nr:hypothetical protein BKA82DRAFT_4359477 [Pisolithus tinctorius]
MGGTTSQSAHLQYMPIVKLVVRYIIEQHVIKELLADMEVPWAAEDEEISDLDLEPGEATTMNPVVTKINLWMLHLTPEQLPVLLVVQAGTADVFDIGSNPIRAFKKLTL